MAPHLHLDPFSGIAGDMLLAGLVHLGAPAGEVEEALNRVPFPGLERVRLAFPAEESHGVRGLRLAIEMEPPPVQTHRTYPELREAIAATPLPDRARQRSLEALELLARAEAKVHGVQPEQVHFHELGGFDTVVDLVGGCLALDLLGVSSVSCGPLPLGRGSIRCAHGVLPSPAPATLELLTGLPTVGLDLELELVTPTGAALARALASRFAPPPPMVLRAAGAGFGTSRLPGRPNCLRLLLGDPTPAGDGRESLWVLEANLDDLPPEILATLPEACLAAGALDAWLTPALMKKGRPAHLLSALCREDARAAVEEAFFRHSSTLGVRALAVERLALERRWAEVATPWGGVRVKLGARGGRVVNRAPEFEDCRRVAEEAGVPLKEVYAAALAGVGGDLPV